MGAGLVDEIHDEPAGVADVPPRVLREAWFTIARNGSWNGRVGPAEIKKAEGRGLDAVFFLLRRAPGDRSGSDETVGEEIGVAGVLAGVRPIGEASITTTRGASTPTSSFFQRHTGRSPFRAGTSVSSTSVLLPEPDGQQTPLIEPKRAS